MRAWIGVVAVVFGIATLIAKVPAARAQQEERRRLAIVVEGTGAAAVRRAIAGELAEMAELASDASVQRAVAQTGGDLGAPFGRAALVRELEVDVVLRATLTRSGRSTRAALVVFGTDGRPVAERDVTGGAGARGRRTIAEAARDLVQTALTTIEERAAEAERRRAAAARARAAAREGEDEDDDDDDLSVNAGAERLAVLAGFGGHVRSLDIDFAEGVTSTHDSGFFPELSLLVRFRPLATSAGLARGLTVELGGAFGLGVSATDAMGEEISSSVLRFHLDAGWVYTLGKLEIGALLGFGLDSFSFDRQVIVPSTSYTYLRLAPVAAFTVVPSGLLKLGLAAGLRIGLGAGDLGDTYGASAIGFDLALTAGGHVGRFVYGVDLGMWLWSLSFDDADADGMTADSGSELSLFGTVRAGIQIW